MDVTPVNISAPEAPPTITVQYLAQGQPLMRIERIAQGTTIEQFFARLSEGHPELTNNRYVRKLTRTGVYDARLLDYTSGNLSPRDTVLADGDLITATGKIEGGN